MTGRPSIYVIGCGGHAKVVLDTLRQLDYSVTAIFDDDSRKCGGCLHGVPTSETGWTIGLRVPRPLQPPSEAAALSVRLQA